MDFNDSFEIESVERESVWQALSDPVTVRNALPGCKCLTRVEGDVDDIDFDALLEESEAAPEDGGEGFGPDELDERAFEAGESYAAVVSVSIGPVNPRFDTVVTIDGWEFPEGSASGEGTTGSSSFTMDSGMVLAETDDGVEVDWEAEVDVFGRLAQMGQRMINPAANRIVKRFFTQVEEELTAATERSESEDEAPTDTDPTNAESGGAAETSTEQGGIVARIKRLLGFGGGA